MCPEKATRVPAPPKAAENQGAISKTTACIPETSRNEPDSSFIACCLRRKPSDTLVFKVSDEAYKDPDQLTIYIVSLWNTPDRKRAFSTRSWSSPQGPGHSILSRRVLMTARPTPGWDSVRESTGIQDLCPESLVVALLKEILYHCPGRKEALFTLEDKLCTKLREVKGKRIVSFQEHLQITFKEFLDKHCKDFRVALLNSVFIVSRMVDNAGKDVGGGSSPSKDTNWSRNSSWNRVRQDRGDLAEQRSSGGNAPQDSRYFRAKVSQPKRKAYSPDPFVEKESPDPEAKGDSHSQGPQAATASDPEGQAEIEEMCPEKATQVPAPRKAAENQGAISKTTACIPETYRNDPDSSFIASCLRRKPSDTLVFKVSDEAYKDPDQLTIDIVSLWNTPDRKRAFIILGVKPLVGVQHQLVGLKSARKPTFYKKSFLWKMFDFPPKFTYREAVFEDKLVGMITVEKIARPSQPSIVKNDERKSRLTKNQLWFRKEGKNVAVAGSEVSNEHVGRIYSWFMQPLEENVLYAQHTVATPAQAQMVSSDIKTEKSSGGTDEEQYQSSGHDSDSHPSPGHKADEASGPTSKKTGDGERDSQGCDSETQLPSELMQAVNFFKQGHFILLCGTLSSTVPNLDALSLVPWIAVYDFDISGRNTGLLAYLEQGLRQRRNTSVFTWMDPHSAVTERGTQWWSLRGQLDKPESNLSDLSPMKWLQKVADKLDKLCTELARLSRDYTLLSILVLWPTAREEMKCMQKFLNELQKRIHAQPSVFLCFTEGTPESADTMEVQNIVEDAEDNVRKVEVDLDEFCSEVVSVFNSVDHGVFNYQLPAETGPVEVKAEIAAWLMQDFEVLYLHNPYTLKEMSAEDLQREGNNFFRGGSLSWLARYDMGAACFDVERSNCKEITKHIEERFVKEFRGGTVRLLHAPGSGGSTMAQRILFDLHEKTPCVHIKQCVGSSIEDIAERLKFLADRTCMPVVALLDGADEQKLQLLRMQLGDCRMVFLHVKRYSHFIDPKRLDQLHRGLVFVQGFVTKKESRNLVVQYQSHCCDTDSVGKKRALQALDQDVQKDRQSHQVFEYGLTVFNHQFQGVQAYVEGYLQLSGHGPHHIQPWQKTLGYLALVYYYAQVSLPCFFIGSIMESSADSVFDIGDLPFAVQMLVVHDVNEGKRNYARVMHYTVAQEILEQILNPGSQRSGSQSLSEAAKLNLKNFCLDFLDHVVSDGDQASFALQSVLTKTFILREDIKMEDAEAGESKKKAKFSAILLDLDSKAPYQGRLEVLEKLCEICPEDANLRAHLGRFYSLCRPDEEEKAERNFRDAVRMATGIELQHKNDLAYIYHMYGCFLRQKMNRKISGLPDTASLLDIIGDAEQACLKFCSCRYYAPLAIRDILLYLCEIDVRLKVCRLVGRWFPGGLQALLQPEKQAAAEYCFIKSSILEIQDLFMECTNSTKLDENSTRELWGRMSQFNATFRGVTRELQALVEDDPLTSLRLKVTAKKLQYATENSMVFVENPGMPSAVMDFVVETLEQIFQRNTYDQIHKDKLELDYRDWVLAIRHANFSKAYSVESVLENVRRWHQSLDGVQSLAVFYRFVLLSLLGLGTSTSPGHEECLEDAGRLKGAVQKQGKGDIKARQPREWLGRDTDAASIRRLVSQGYVSLNQHRVTATAQAFLAVCKGTVERKLKESCGFITMDRPYPKQRGGKHSVRVFFVPVHAQVGMFLLKGTRVQFYLAFTQENGYQAYDVSRLDRIKCSRCGLWVEITRDQTSVTCHGTTRQERPCNATVQRRDNVY
ncbi:hypothetical protein ACOMHN_005632 [Nucella lapillus]